MSTSLPALLLFVALASPAAAQSPADDHPSNHGAATGVAAKVDLADAVVRRVDLEGSRLTLKHGEIKSLDMPPMTMVFGVRDKTLLDGVKVGDKVRFRAVVDAGKYTVTELEVVK